jgi:hypothetical protein
MKPLTPDEYRELKELEKQYERLLHQTEGQIQQHKEDEGLDLEQLKKRLAKLQQLLAKEEPEVDERRTVWREQTEPQVRKALEDL